MKIVAPWIFLCIALVSSQSLVAAPARYTFEGVVTGFSSIHQDYDISDYDIVVGETAVRYVFIVDLAAANSTFTNSAGTWNYFYSDLSEGSIVNGGYEYGDYYGFNWYRNGGANMGEISSRQANVRISTDASQTTDWQVQDWQVGQNFQSADSACYPGGDSGCAVYAYANVELTGITAVPLPGALVLFASSIAGLGLARRARQRHASANARPVV